MATILVLALTAGCTTLQFLWPIVLEKLCRDPVALKNGEWWRVISPILVHDGGWTQIAFNFTVIAVVGTFVERIYGPRRWLIFYLLAGMTGEIAGYAWQPQGAGASVAGAGLLGALLLWLVAKRGLPWPARVGGTIGLLAAVAMSAIQDLHGPPILVGAALASEFILRDAAPIADQTVP